MQSSSYIMLSSNCFNIIIFLFDIFGEITKYVIITIIFFFDIFKRYYYNNILRNIRNIIYNIWCIHIWKATASNYIGISRISHSYEHVIIVMLLFFNWQPSPYFKIIYFRCTHKGNTYKITTNYFYNNHVVLNIKSQYGINNRFLLFFFSLISTFNQPYYIGT